MYTAVMRPQAEFTKRATMDWITKLVSPTVQATRTLRAFGLFKIPLLFYVRPSVVEITADRLVVKVPLRRRTRNHLGGMYFGALCIGADCAAALLAAKLIRKRPERISLVFKDVRAEFLKRAEGDVHFFCGQGREIAGLVAEAAGSEDRVEMPITVVATVPSQDSDTVARFTLTLSLKRRS